MNVSRLLRNYIGPEDYVNWPDKTKREMMEKHIQLIQDKADQIYEKFKSFFAFQVRFKIINFIKSFSQFVI